MTSTEQFAHSAPPLDERLANGFAELLAPNFVLEQLEVHPSSIFGLFADGRLAYVNPAWVRFARDNGAGFNESAQEWIGHRYLDVITGALRPFYERLFALAPEAGSALHPVSHVYECSTPDLFRQFAMKVYALGASGGHVVINTLVASRPHDHTVRTPREPDPSPYMSSDGVILQCAHCRLVRRADRSAWDWVPAWVEQVPPGMSHGVCDVCFEYYYPDVT